MVVILVGCDCTGKSTCVDSMDKSIGKFCKGSANVDLTMAIMNLESDLIKQGLVIHDRIPLIDDIVYSQVFSHRPSRLMNRVIEISELLEKCIVIYFDCDNEEIARRMRERGDHYVEENQIPEIKEEYEKTFEILGINPIRIDTTHKTPEVVYDEVMEVIRKNEELQNS